MLVKHLPALLLANSTSRFQHHRHSVKFRASRFVRADGAGVEVVAVAAEVGAEGGGASEGVGGEDAHCWFRVVLVLDLVGYCSAEGVRFIWVEGC